ncbi:MAG: hypothetical protein J0H74_20725 [Chitinophagaceae bacterium]|nr:hypothetical protein [Chitinophagaceae bacterium]
MSTSRPVVLGAADAGTIPITITIDENTYYQPIDGFGYCLTDGSAGLEGLESESISVFKLNLILKNGLL